MNSTLIIPDKCYLYDTCKKYIQGQCDLLANSFCIRLYKTNMLFDLSLLTNTQRIPMKLYLGTEKKDTEAYTRLSHYKNDILNFVSQGTNLYIYSEITGNGKTSWAIKFIQTYIRKIWAQAELTCKALFISVPKYTRELKLNIEKQSNYIQHINQYILSADLVVWDDIATKSTTDYEHEQFLAMLESRLDDKKSNIFTSNIIPNKLETYVGTRLASRILGNSTPICFYGNDKRGCEF